MANKVGVFDSGIGGIYTLKALQKAYQDVSFVFLADQLHMPYGTKTNQQILEYSTCAMQFFIQQGCSIVIVACNTVSSNALAQIQERFKELLIIGTIIPTVKQLVEPKHVLVCATNATIKNDAYRREIQSIWPSTKVDNCAASILVPMIEENKYDTQAIQTLFSNHRHEYDIVIMGCTHFPVMKEIFKEAYPSSLIVDSIEPLIAALKPYANTLDCGETRYYSSLKTRRFQLEVELILESSPILIEEPIGLFK